MLPLPSSYSFIFLFLLFHSVTLSQLSSIQLEYDVSGFGKFFTKGVLHYDEGDSVFFVKDTLSESERGNAIGTEIPDFKNAPLTPDDIASGKTVGSTTIKVERVPKLGDIKYHVQTNLNEEIRLSKRVYPYLRKTYLVEEKMGNIKWQLKSDKRVIAGFECQKAIGTFGGRSYTVWYTPEIPISVGPWKLDGLPGAILQGAEDNHRIAFSLADIHYNSPRPEVPDLNSNSHEVIHCEKSFELHEKDFEILMKNLRAKAPRGIRFGEPKSNQIQLECP